MDEKRNEERDPLTEKIIGAAIEVHRIMGPGLLESAYQECLYYELKLRGLKVEREVVLPIRYKELVLPEAYRIDFVVEDQVIVETKTIDTFQEVHEAQILTYMRFSGHRKGLLINFRVPLLKLGIRRFIMSSL